MPQTIVPPPVPINVIDITWPPLLRSIVSGSAFVVTADGRWPNIPSVYTLWDAPVGGGTANMGTMHGDQLPCGQLVNSKTINMDGFPISIPLTVATWPAALRVPEVYRVTRVTWMMDFQGGSPTEQTGIQFIASGGTVGGWNIAAANTGAFGIVGDGAGGLNFFTKKGAGTYLTTALTLPNVITECVKYEIQITSADGRGAAGLAVLINDTVVTLSAARSSWAGVTELPIYSNSSVANGNKFVPVVQANDGAAITMRFGAMRMSMGKFTYDGSGAVVSQYGNDFDTVMQFVLREEGGWNPSDPSFRGVMQTTYDTYRTRKGLPKQDVRSMTVSEMNDIYFNEYWVKSGAGGQDWTLQLIHMDAAVNQGVGAAKTLLAQSGGDPVTYLKRRVDRYKATYAANPVKHTNNYPVWIARVQRGANATGVPFQAQAYADGQITDPVNPKSPPVTEAGTSSAPLALLLLLGASVGLLLARFKR